MKDIEFITRIQVNGEKRELTKEEASELILRRVKEALEGMNYEKTAYVEMYQSGDIPYLCDAVTAAMGKLDVECGSLKLAGLMNDWVEYIRGLCMEDEMVAHQVRKKGKSLKQCIAEILKYAFKNQVPVDKEIIKAAGVNAGKVTFGDPDMGTAKKLIRDYYLGGSRK